MSTAADWVTEGREAQLLWRLPVWVGGAVVAVVLVRQKVSPRSARFDTSNCPTGSAAQDCARAWRGKKDAENEAEIWSCTVSLGRPVLMA